MKNRQSFEVTNRQSAESPSADFRPLGPVGAAPLLEKARATRRSGLLEVCAEGEVKALLRLRRGSVVEARSGTLRGREAVMRIFLWPDARYRWLADAGAEALPAELETTALVTEGLRRRAVWQLMLRELPPLDARYVVDFARLSAMLGELPPVAHDLCRLFDGRRTLNEVFADAAMPELEAASIVGHLLASGVVTALDATPKPTPTAAVASTLELPKQEADPGAPAPSPAPSLRTTQAAGQALEVATPLLMPSVLAAEQTDLVEVPPRRPRPSGWRRGAIGLGLCVGVGGMFGLGRVMAPAAPEGIALHHVSPRVAPTTQTNDSESSRGITSSLTALPEHAGRPISPRRPEKASTPAAARTADVEVCLRGRDADLGGKTVAACERLRAAGNPGAEVVAVLARAALEQGRFGRASELARQALALDPGLAEAYAYLGFAEAEAGRRAAALAAYRRYLALAPQGRYAPDIRAIVSR